MIDATLFPWGILAAPIIFAGICIVFRSPESVLRSVVAGALVSVGLCVSAALTAIMRGNLTTAGRWFHIDALSAYHLLVMSAVFAASSVYSLIYFKEEIARGRFDLSTARRFGVLWLGTLSSLTLALISNNLGIQWVGIETTTLLTAFLVCLHPTRPALEAMWKYLLICSVGVALAFMGLLLIASAGPPDTAHSLFWTRLVRDAGTLQPALVKAGFIFLLVGYGTKVGLVPMHSWLPDAHSQAPAPVSALFSGFLLNAAAYCLMRLIPIAEGATGAAGWSLHILRLFGLASIVIAAAFILFQKDLKRLLAYSSIENLGIITLGLGLGGLGTFAALYHTFNHSLCKILGFFAAGRMGQIYGTHEMDRLNATLRVSPIWGLGLFGAFLALLGVAPFAPFMSKLMMVKAAIGSGRILTLTLFMAGTAAVFVGVIGRVISMSWSTAPPAVVAGRGGAVDVALVFGILGTVLVLGVWMPDAFTRILWDAAKIVGGDGGAPPP